MYSKDYGASTNEGEPNYQSGVGEQAFGLLEPAHVLGALALEPVREVEAAGRPALLVRGKPRGRDREGAFMLFRLGAGADEYELVFDLERGVLLRMTSLLDNLPLRSTEVLEIAFDEDFPAETFRFELPAGESFRPLFPQPEPVTLERAAELAPFTVLSPAEVPPDWQLHVHYQPGEDRPPMPPTASLHYHSRDASQQVTITQTATAALDQYEWLVWEERDNVLVAGPAEPHGLEPGYARVERDGTRATLSSAELSRERLVALALSLEPALNPQRPPKLFQLPFDQRCSSACSIGKRSVAVVLIVIPGSRNGFDASSACPSGRPRRRASASSPPPSTASPSRRRLPCRRRGRRPSRSRPWRTSP